MKSEEDPLLTRKEAAKYIGIKNANTLAVWASTGRYNLEFLKVGSKAVRYRKSSLDKFLNLNLKP